VAEAAVALGSVTGGGLTVEPQEGVQAATLRYFARDGAFADAVRAATGAVLPGALQAHRSAEGLTFAWRSPTETWLLAADAAPLANLEAHLADARAGCIVNLTGGLRVLRVRGGRISDLLCRLGGTGCVPAPGEARRGRLADVAVLALALDPRETLLVVDRAYAEHLFGWIRETLLDCAAP